LKMIHESVAHDGVSVEEVAADYVYRLRKGDRSFLMLDAEVGLNSSASAKIARSKSSTSEVLRRAGVPAVEHVFLPHPGRKYRNVEAHAAARDLFVRYGCRAVVKPDGGSQGKHVYKVDSLSGLEETLDNLFALEHDAAISPFLESGLEYRVVTLCGQPKVLLGKRREQSWKHNLAQGARPVDVDARLTAPLADLAAAASEALGLDFCSVDILETSDGLLVLEVNDKVMLDHYLRTFPERVDQVSALYREAILTRFARERAQHSRM